MFNLASALDHSAKQYPEKTAVVCGSTRLSYGQMDQAVNRITNGLAAAGSAGGTRSRSVV